MLNLLSKLTIPFSNAAISRPSLPGNDLYYVIGDIHGRLDLIENIHQQILKDINKNDPNLAITIIYLGDYVDRGDQSRQVVDHLLSRPLGSIQSIFLKGNHEDALLQFLDSPDIGANWFSFGGMATLFSYGVTVQSSSPNVAQFEYIQKQFASNLPDEHLAFFSNLDLSHQAGDYLFVHAGILPGRKLAKQRPEDLMWIRDEFLESHRNHEKFVVHGHSVTSEPEIRHNRIGIDTGAYFSNHLTCLVLCNDEKRFLLT